MRRMQIVLIAAAFVVPSLHAQNFAPPPAKTPDEATLKEIAVRTEKLGKAIESLRKQGIEDPQLADVEIYHKATVWIVRHGEFYQPDFAAWTLGVLDRGLLRASQAGRGESPWLSQTGQAVVRGYRSRVDDSVQPYAVIFPLDYGKNPKKRWRLDVVLHGRDSSLTEVKFLHMNSGERPVPKDQEFVQLIIHGRGNNAYRWAGETDVHEAMNHLLLGERLLGRDNLIDPNRWVLRGFSMGGAGTWHLGLHHPDRWAVLGPGAGFTTTRGYIKDLPPQLPAYQEACLHIYDAIDYAENAANVPIVAYGGTKDPQLQASLNIEAKLKPLGIPMTHLIAQDLAHTFPPEWQKKAEAEYARHAGPGKGRTEYPERVHFVTYTLRYPTCAWVDILNLQRHYDRTLVDAARTATGFTVKTTNVRTLRLGLPPEEKPLPLVVSIDGQEVNAQPYQSQTVAASVYLERRDGRWHSVLPQKILTDRFRRLQKVNGLQGPIDDAFMDRFLCVRGTGKPWHAATQKYADGNFERFAFEWNKFLRGKLPIKNDVDVTEQDIASSHLILFGDPSSNSLIAQVLDGLPLKWTPQAITLGSQSVPAAEHVPVLVYPSPLSVGRYVVLNSGHTFHAAEFRGTNAQLYPRLGDHALLKLAATDKDPLATDVITAGLFDDNWQLPPRR